MPTLPQWHVRNLASRVLGLCERRVSADWQARFGCRYRNGRYEVPSCTRIRDVLIRVEPDALDGALQGWNAQMAVDDEGLAIDGKTMRNAIDAEGHQAHILGVVGHESKVCHTQKKSPLCRSVGADLPGAVLDLRLAAPVASSDAELRIEEATSSRFSISGVQVRRKPGALSVSGDVSRIIPHRGLISGEVEVRVVGPDGVVLAEDSTTPMRRNRQARSAHFFVRLPIDAPAGSTLQIVHRRG